MPEPRTTDNWLLNLTVTKFISYTVAIVVATSYVNHELYKGLTRDNKIEDNINLIIEGDNKNYERTSKITSRNYNYTTTKFEELEHQVKEVRDDNKVLTNQLIEALINLAEK